MNKLEILQQKITLYLIKKSLIEEMNKPYYYDDNNIDKIIDLGSKCVNLSATDVTYNIKNITLYKNGLFKYKDCIEAAATFPDEFDDKEIINNLIKKGR